VLRRTNGVNFIPASHILRAFTIACTEGAFVTLSALRRLNLTTNPHGGTSPDSTLLTIYVWVKVGRKPTLFLIIIILFYFVYYYYYLLLLLLL